MKKILFLSILFLGLSACEKIDKFTQFSVDYSTAFDMPIDATTQTPLELGTFTLGSDSDIFSEYDTSKDLIDKATLKNIELSINNNTNNSSAQNFDFLTDLEIYLLADDLPTLRVAWKNDMQNTGDKNFELEHLSDNLADYFKKDKVKIKIMAKTDEVLSQPVTVDVKLSVYIDAQLLGK